MNAKACTEVCEILKYVSNEDYNKISKDFIQIIESKKDIDYNFKINVKIELDKQNLLRETKVILAIIYKNYWATIEEKNRINRKFQYDLKKNEIKKREKYNPNDVFKNKEKISESIENKNVALIEYKESFFSKILNKIKQIFHR